MNNTVYYTSKAKDERKDRLFERYTPIYRSPMRINNKRKMAGLPLKRHIQLMKVR